MRNFRPIFIKEKILIVCQVIAGAKIQSVARKYAVSRTSLYAWTRKALDTLEQALKPGKREPKFKKGKVDAKDKLIEGQKEKIAELKDITEQKEKQIKNLKGKINLQKNSLSRPLKCPHCGFEKIYKNDTYKIRGERLFELLKKDNKEIEITVHRSLLQKLCLYAREKKKNNSFLMPPCY